MSRRPRFTLLAAGLAVALIPSSNAADYLDVTELAGLRWEDLGNGDGTGHDARFLWPTGVTVDSQGVIYVADSATVRRISPDGEVTTVAGRAFNPGYVNGAGISARFNSTRAIVVDGSGNLYVAEDGNHTIRKITPSREVSTFAGLGGVTGTANGLGADSRFNLPRGLALDSDGVLHVADQGNARIRRISPDGMVSDAYPLAAPYNRTGLEGLSFDPARNLVASDWRVGRLFKLSPDGSLAAFSGKATGEFSYLHLDGPADQALFANPTGIAVAADGHVFVADTRGECIREVAEDGSVTTLAGKGLTPGTEDGTGDTARFGGPRGIALAPDGSLIVADSENSAIRRVTRDGITTTVAGQPGVPGPVPWGTNDGPALAARFRSPGGVTVAPNGDVFVADRFNHTIRRITADLSVTTFAGNPGVAGTNDAPRNDALFRSPAGVAADNAGNLYVADSGNHTIRKIAPAGAVTTLAGQPRVSGYVDEQGAAARFNQPTGLTIEADGNILVADQLNHMIRRVTPDGVVTRVAGNGQSGSVNNITVLSSFSQPSAVAVAPDGSLLVADTGNSIIRRIGPDFMVTTLAGQPRQTGTQDGFGDNARFNQPRGILVTATGRILVADSGNRIVRELTLAGEVRTVAGMAGQYDSVSGYGTSARFITPDALAASPTGAIIITDSGAHTVRSAIFAEPPPPRLTLNLTGADLVLSWPALAADFRLEATEDLTASPNWETVLDLAVTPEGTYTSTNRLSSERRLFRLRKD